MYTKQQNVDSNYVKRWIGTVVKVRLCFWSIFVVLFQIVIFLLGGEIKIGALYKIWIKVPKFSNLLVAHKWYGTLVKGNEVRVYVYSKKPRYCEIDPVYYPKKPKLDKLSIIDEVNYKDSTVDDPN